MAKVTCKFCGKVWHNRGEYLSMKTCDVAACPAMIMRNERHASNQPIGVEVTRPKHINPQPNNPRQIRIATHYKEVVVESSYDENEPVLEVEVPKIIMINILKMGK